MSRKPENPPAFARPYSKGAVDDHENMIFAQEGMSLRDYFAGKALAQLVEDYGPSSAAYEAYQYADAMLAEREKANA